MGDKFLFFLQKVNLISEAEKVQTAVEKKPALAKMEIESS